MTKHVSSDRLSDYLAGLLEEPQSEELEAHLFSCRTCAAASERLFALAAAIREAVLPVLSPERFQELGREGRIAEVNTMSPGQVVETLYPPGDKVLVHRLGGSDLSRARRVDVALLDLEGRPLTRYDDIPFDAARGEVLMACQRHFADVYPQDIMFSVQVAEGEQREEVNRYTVLHRL
ncbi:MAG TPA: zf-HC2 domain-containing protein [Vicinamibacteria bacterium]